jgi:hypothetical protein
MCSRAVTMRLVISASSSAASTRRMGFRFGQRHRLDGRAARQDERHGISEDEA